MANLQINQLPSITGNTLLETDIVPVQTSSGTKGISVEELLQEVLLQNRDLLNKCNVLNTRLASKETYDHIIINQYYGGGIKEDTGSVSHAFIELYNPTDSTVSLEGKSVQYVKDAVVQKLDLTGEIPSKHSFLIRCKLTNSGTPALSLTEKTADMEWDQYIANKGISILLMKNTELVSVDSSLVDNPNVIDVIGSSGDAQEAVKFFEGEVVVDQSKQKSVRRILFSDTNNNKVDCEIVDFRLKGNLTKAPRCKADGAWGTSNVVN